ncbi:DUF1992 domain-containing protein [Neobacillus novalis]|uniref:DUF1992 domain-containing protein n=1 Tax=Neobacillus novalis TaxID=220687 RepID=A0AA95MSD5_9BACI|nr:DUF1992 domain-containing protein [Neobacillus novalis]WHY88730.1 DUF1992 domain-containing protein [Neobacillus novalis]
MASKKDDGHVNWMDQVSKDYNLDEEMKKHPGFGKPLPSRLFSGDIYSNFVNTAKEAGYLPPFVALQKEIGQEIAKALKLKEENTKESELTNVISEINLKIQKYNSTCPPSMQRGRISLDNIEKLYKIWE